MGYLIRESLFYGLALFIIIVGLAIGIDRFEAFDVACLVEIIGKSLFKFPMVSLPGVVAEQIILVVIGNLIEGGDPIAATHAKGKLRIGVVLAK